MSASKARIAAIAGTAAVAALLFAAPAIAGNPGATLGPGVRDVEKPASYAVADSSTYDGLDPETIISEHCFQCHSIVPYRGADYTSPNPLTDWLLKYKARSARDAQFVAEKMAIVCNGMTQEQIDALAAFYTPEQA